MTPDHLPQVAGRLRIIQVEDRVEDGVALIRADTSPPVEVAVAHDGSTESTAEAERYARLLGMSPLILALLVEALGAWAGQFDSLEDQDACVPGADLVEWFAGWRLRVRAVLTDPAPPA